MKFRTVPDRFGRKLRKRMLRGALPVLGAGITRFPTLDGTVAEVALAYVDCRHRPDVADLGRVHRLEGKGDHIAKWAFLLAPGRTDVEPLAVLTLNLYRPVSCRFSVAIPVRQHAEVLAAVCLNGIIALTPRDPAAAGAAGEMLGMVAWTVPVEELRQALAAETIGELAAMLLRGRVP